MDDMPKFKTELDRQTQILTDAINEAIMNAAEQFSVPMMNALAGALVTVQGRMLSSVPAGPTRKALRNSMENALSRAIVVAQGSAGTCLVVTIGHDKNKMN
jgi:hypothetical protein